MFYVSLPVVIGYMYIYLLKVGDKRPSGAKYYFFYNNYSYFSWAMITTKLCLQRCWKWTTNTTVL